MALYFFTLSGASDGVNDSDGEKFISDAAALNHINSSISEIINDGIRPGLDFLRFAFEVRDQLGQLIATVPSVETTMMSPR